MSTSASKRSAADRRDAETFFRRYRVPPHHPGEVPKRKATSEEEDLRAQQDALLAEMQAEQARLMKRRRGS